MPTSSRPARITLYVVLSFVLFAGISSTISQVERNRADDRATSARERSDEISRCLTGYRLIYVDGPSARAREAEKVVLRLVARGETDTPAYAEAVDRFVAIPSDVDMFEDLNRKARLDPDVFVRECRRRNP